MKKPAGAMKPSCAQLDRQRPLIVALKTQRASPSIPGIAQLSALLIEALLDWTVDNSYDD